MSSTRRMPSVTHALQRFAIIACAKPVPLIAGLDRQRLEYRDVFRSAFLPVYAIETTDVAVVLRDEEASVASRPSNTVSKSSNGCWIDTQVGTTSSCMYMA